jgi:hypothetical protein
MINSRELARLGWHHFFLLQRTLSSITPFLHRLPHPSHQYLTRLASTGAPSILTAPPWSLQQKNATMLRGPHRSAINQFKNFLLADMFDYINMGYWTVLPYESICHHPALRLSPVGVVPQNERRPRPIMDYSFYGVNAAALPIAPQHAMQFGGTLQRLLQRIVYCNRSYAPPLLAKIDLADGYYRVPVAATTALHLAVILPPDGPCPHLVALPLSLPMVWTHSPPYFCVYTETVADLANAAKLYRPQHPLFSTTQKHHQPPPTTFHPMAITLPSTSDEPLNYHDIYIDDFITVAQQPVHTQAMNNLLHTLDQVFANPTDSPRRAILSESKMERGDTAFSTNHTILGWNIDTYTMTLTLPQHRLNKMTLLITLKLTQKYTSVKGWRELLGVLRSSSPALYRTIQIFSILQHALGMVVRGTNCHSTHATTHISTTTPGHFGCH